MISALVRFLTLSFIFCLFTYQLSAQNVGGKNAHYHDFDFWIGTWDVYKFGTDTLVGFSQIRPILNHRMIEENYKAINSPYQGTSNNVYNIVKERWEQHWVDNSGLVLHITGGLEGSRMILSECVAQNCNKIIWTPLTDNTVRQEWLQSKDEGKSWVKVFDGHYIPKHTTSRATPVLEHLVNYPNNRDFTISKDGKEAYLTVQNTNEATRVICRITKTNGIWSKPIPVKFSGEHRDLEPYLSPDNLKLFFVSDRPNLFEKVNYDIYYVERKDVDSSWSAPINLGAPVNTIDDEFYPSISSNGNLYFTCVKSHNNGKDDIYLSRYKNGLYSTPIALDTAINTDGYEFNSFIAPDESYILFSGYNRPDGLGSGDLYISYKKEDGTWEKAKNMGKDVNTRYMEYCPFVDVTNNVLYFTSRRHEQRKKVIKNNFELEREVLKYENGSTRIYKVMFEGK